MKLADAKPGDILQDRDGDTWVRMAGNFAICIVQHGEPEFELRRSDARRLESAELCGPFVRLVPEEAAEW